MLNKVILSGSYDFREAPVRLIEATDRQLATDGLAKTAGVADVFGGLADVQMPKNHTVVHVIAVGDGERWGPNRNGDSFSRDDNRTAHRLFKEIGHVFRNHRNSNPKLKVGDTLATAHNDALDRIELMLALDNEKCRDEIEQLHTTGELATSMGSQQEFDVCSFCGHKAKRASDHCNHIRNYLGEVAHDGTKVCMLNPNPRYFDISLVFKPADRIAYMLRKVASATDVIGGHELAESMGLIAYDNPKVATMVRLAEILKETPVKLRLAPSNLDARPKSLLKQAACRNGVEEVLGMLHRAGLLLSPRDFGEIVLNLEDGNKMDVACEHHSPSLEDMATNDPVFVEALEGRAPGPLANLDLTAEDFQNSCAMEGPGARQRSVRIVLIPETKVAAAYEDVAELQGLAHMYNLYKVAFAHVNERHFERVANVALTF